MTNNDEITGNPCEDIRVPDLKYKCGQNKLDSFNWLKDLPPEVNDYDIVEIRFKNTRKGFYRNVNNLRLETGDIVAVESSPGHDIGRVSMTGLLVREQMKKLKIIPSPDELKIVYRKAKDVDIQKWEEAKALEIPTMLKSRQIAEDLKLDMKIGDVEYQGDKTKAIFYYIADERVDFRQLIKVLAEEFRVRIEMRQIGARQEAGRIGGIGSCGRELCCSTHITSFSSVTTTHAKYQELSLNPQKLAGQCSKLKCCLFFEFDCYVDAQKQFPSRETPLELLDKTMWFQKMEVHKGIYWYSDAQNSNMNMTAVPVARVKEIQDLNKKGVKPDRLLVSENGNDQERVSADVLDDTQVSRFTNKNVNSQKKQNSFRRRKHRFNDKNNK
jgi:cell fate regulator YaaT (PSP1 superfamily)